jgi:hypothetical protein
MSAEMICDFWDFACRMDAHEGQAAWVQAIGSILAILASGAFAVLAPIWSRDVEAREIALKAGKNIVVAGNLAITSWKSLELILKNSQFNIGTRSLLSGDVLGIRSVLAEAPRACLGPNALIVASAFQQSLSVFERIIANIADEMEQHGLVAGWQGRAHAIPFNEIVADLEVKCTIASKLIPTRIAGMWHIDVPSEIAEEISKLSSDAIVRQ